MVEFTFDASSVKPWLGAPHETPEYYALRLWLAAPEDLDFATATTLASVDGE